jgi:hypothetical protein
MASFNNVSQSSKVVGYVTNIITPTILDIDLKIPAKEKEFYKHAIRTEYIYQDFDTKTHKFSENINGKTYRCKVRNLTTNYNLSSNEGVKRSKEYINFKLKSVKSEMHRQLNMQGGFTFVNVYGIDNQHNIIVDLYDPITKLNITSIHLSEKHRELFIIHRNRLSYN